MKGFGKKPKNIAAIEVAHVANHTPKERFFCRHCGCELAALVSDGFSYVCSLSCERNLRETEIPEDDYYFSPEPKGK